MCSIQTQFRASEAARCCAHIDTHFPQRGLKVISVQKSSSNILQAQLALWDSGGLKAGKRKSADSASFPQKNDYCTGFISIGETNVAVAVDPRSVASPDLINIMKKGKLVKDKITHGEKSLFLLREELELS